MKIQVCTFFAVYLLFAMMIIFNIMNASCYLLNGEESKCLKTQRKIHFYCYLLAFWMSLGISYFSYQYLKYFN